MGHCLIVKDLKHTKQKHHPGDFSLKKKNFFFFGWDEEFQKKVAIRKLATKKKILFGEGHFWGEGLF